MQMLSYSAVGQIHKTPASGVGIVIMFCTRKPSSDDYIQMDDAEMTLK